MVRVTLSAAVLAMSALLAGCNSPAKPSAPISAELKKFQGLEGKIAIAGGTAHIPVMKEAVKRINLANPDIRITVAGGGSGVGVKKVGEGLVEIGNTGRAITAKEKESYGLITFPFALDCVTIIVHPSNPVTGLSTQQMKRLYAGEVANWKEVGGPDGAVHLLMRDEASGTRDVFWKVLLDKGTIAPGANVAASNGAVKVAVGKDPQAIGYTSLGHVDDTVKTVALDGVAPTRENALSGKYRVTRKLYMNTKGQPSRLVQTFIDYLRSPEGDDIIRAAGFIPVKEQADRMRDITERWMARLLGSAAFVSAAAVFAILAFLVYSAIPFFWTSDLGANVMTGWRPDATPPSYGIGPMVVGSLLLAVLATAIAFPASVGVCLFTQGLGPRWLGRVVLVVVHGMTAIPTVVYGFAAVLLLVPVLRATGWGGGSGYSLLAAGLTLSLLILPTMVLLMRVRIATVDAQVSLGCTALGMSRLQTLRRVVLPLSRRGLMAGLVLGFCRALGDTMIALMVSGNAPQIPMSPTDSVRTLTAHIALQLATDWRSPEFRSVAGAGLLLFLLTTGLTIALQRLETQAEVAHDELV